MTNLRALARRGRGAPSAQPPAPVYLVSAAGQPNYGDELITRAWLEYLAHRLPGVDVWLDCPEPGRAIHLFRRFHPRLRTTNTLWQLAHLPEEAGPCGYDSIVSAVRNLGSPKLDPGLAALREMRSIHLLGGGYITSLWPRNLGLVMAAVAAAEAHETPIFATGQGWMPLDASEADWLRANVGRFVIAEARDPATSRALGVPLGLDDAYLSLGDPAPDLRDPDAPDVMLLVQGDMAQHLGREDALGVLEAFLDEYGGDGRIGVAEAIPPEDSWLLADVLRIRPDAEFISFGRIWDQGFPARADQRWLTTRFHAHLMAAAAGASGTVFSVLPGYYDVKHELLLENGTGWSYAASIDEARGGLPVPSSAPDFPERARLFARRKRDVADRIYARD